MGKGKDSASGANDGGGLLAKCHYCGRELTFANVIYLMNTVVACKCECSPERQLKVSSGSKSWDELLRVLTAGWEGVRTPYSPAELPPFVVEDIIQECNRMALAMRKISCAEEFEAACVEERAIPTSADGEE